MADAKNKTVPTGKDVEAFIDTLPDEGKRADSRMLVALFQDVSAEPAMLWGSIVGFGSYHYRYDSGREGDSLRVGFAPRKGDLTLYLMGGFESDAMAAQRARLGKHKVGKACLYVKRLSDIDMVVLADMIRTSLTYMDEKYPRVVSA